MRWISKYQPLYVWEGDRWYREADGKTFICDIAKRIWSEKVLTDPEIVYFTPKTKIMNNNPTSSKP